VTFAIFSLCSLWLNFSFSFEKQIYHKGHKGLHKEHKVLINKKEGIPADFAEKRGKKICVYQRNQRELNFFYPLIDKKLKTLSVNVQDFNFRIARQKLAQFANVHIHASGGKKIIIEPDSVERKFAGKHIVDVNAKEF